MSYTMQQEIRESMSSECHQLPDTCFALYRIVLNCPN